MKITTLSKTLTLFASIVAIGSTASCVDPAATTAAASSNATVSVDPTSGKKIYPLAKPVLDANGKPKKDRFISPYRPYNPIDTKGYSAGDVVGDPSTAQINKKTGKIIATTAKPFQIPSPAPVPAPAPAPAPASTPASGN